MKRKMILSIGFLFVLAACSGEESVNTDDTENEAAMDEATEEEEAEDPAETDASEEAASTNEEFEFEAVIEASDDAITLTGTSNLHEGTVISARMFSDPFRIRPPIGTGQRTEVDENGAFTFQFTPPSIEHRFMDVELTMDPSHQPDDLSALYGELGEHLTGAQVYQTETFQREEGQKLYGNKTIFITDDQKQFHITPPDREEGPSDYGENEIWVETTVTNDHQYFYIEGRTNLIEGTSLKGDYYSSDSASIPQNWVSFKTTVEPDGTFLMRLGYSDLKAEGFIQLESDAMNLNLLPGQAEELYGENYENISGEFVVEDGDGKKLQKIIYPETPDFEAPEESNLTSSGDETKVHVPDDVLFDFDESSLKAKAEDILTEIITILESLEDGTRVHIKGHTDNQGDAEYNLNLSEERAESVKTYLDENGDLSGLEIEQSGRGETDPIASNEDEEGRKQNRRVEIVINPEE